MKKKIKYLYATTEEDVAKANAQYHLASLPSKSILILAVLSGIVFILSIWSMLTVLID